MGRAIKGQAITFTLPGTPVGKARARVVPGSRAYTPRKTVAYEKAIGWAAKAEMLNDGLDMVASGIPISLRVAFYFPFPKSWTKGKREAIAGTPHLQKPDTSNLIKTVEDALTGILYPDDSQVYYVQAYKYWTSPSFPGRQGGLLIARLSW